MAVLLNVRQTLATLTSSWNGTVITARRGIARIPHWEYHIRFDPKEGRKRPCEDVLDRFKRLNNGMWIRAQMGRNVKRYRKDETFLKTSYYYETCTKEECWMLDRMMTPFWIRPKYYVDDPYEPYNVRHGIKAPRIGLNGKFARERQKILLEDSVADRYFHDR